MYVSVSVAIFILTGKLCIPSNSLDQTPSNSQHRNNKLRSQIFLFILSHGYTKRTFQENSGPLNPGSEEGEDWLSEDRSGNKQIKTDSSDSLYINRSLDSDYLHSWWNWWWLWNAHLKYKSVINNVLYLYVFFKIQNIKHVFRIFHSL